MIQDKLYPTFVAQDEGMETPEAPEEGEMEVPKEAPKPEEGAEAPEEEMPSEEMGGEEETPEAPVSQMDEGGEEEGMEE